MIYIRPIGGLGNFLFHIAAIWSLAKDNNDELCLLDVDAKISIMKRDEIWNAPHAEDYKFLFNRFPNNSGIAPPQIQHPFTYVPMIYRPEHEYCGYFQSEKNFIHRRNDILKLFSPPIEFEEKINKYSDFFGHISLHVRRGNFIKYFSDIYPTQKVDGYYKDAIDLMPKNLKILVFSDDILWCKENFIGDRFVFIDEIDYISLYIMSKMRYHITANSTFSWWGAWLSPFIDKVIATPGIWISNKEYNTIDLLPNSWIKL
jgi:hypothetical protein